MSGLGNRDCWRVSQVCDEHQHERRDHTERQKRIDGWQDPAQVGARAARQVPNNRRSRQTADGRNSPRPRRDLELSVTFGTHDVV